MAFKFLKQFEDKVGWQVEGNVAYNETGNYLFTAVGTLEGTIFLTPLHGINEDEEKRIVNYLKSNKKILKLRIIKLEDGFLEVRFKETFKKVRFETVQVYIKDLINFLSETKISNKKMCTFCNEEGVNEKAYINGIYVYAHSHCVSKASYEVEEFIEEFDNDKKNYTLGFIGAMVGGIVCSIPFLLAQYYLETIYAVLAYLIGFGAMKSYFLFKGYLGKLTRWIVLVATFSSVVVSQFVSLGLEFHSRGIPVELHTFKWFFGIEENVSIFKSNLLMALFMGSLGVLSLFFSLNGKGKDVAPKIERAIN